MIDPLPEPVAFVAFGATGDLWKRKLFPAIYRLAVDRFLIPPSVVLGVGRTPLDDAAFRSLCTGAVPSAQSSEVSLLNQWVESTVAYQHMTDEGPEDYRALGARLTLLETERKLPGNRLFYLALPFDAFGPTIDSLGAAGLNQSRGWTRVVLEKPFGRDLKSAQQLNARCHKFFDESQIYRIDHYLGKETVQNLLVFRFANTFFESLWNRDRIAHVEITVAEDLGVEHRASYYELSGALRDMVQNHLTQLLTLTAMEVPEAIDPDAIRSEKVKVLRTIAPIRADDVVFGQYDAGTVDGQKVGSYRSEPGVNPQSKTETFVALRLSIPNWRWQGVPFYLRTGKRLPAKTTRIVVSFRAPPVAFFQSIESPSFHPNTLTLTLQPDEGFELSFELKPPGPRIAVQTHTMHFRYSEAFGPLAEAYQTLLLDVLRGDATLFVRADEVEASWRLYTPLLEHPPIPLPYASGTIGPDAALRLFGGEAHGWSDL